MGGAGVWAGLRVWGRGLWDLVLRLWFLPVSKNTSIKYLIGQQRAVLLLQALGEEGGLTKSS